MSQTEHCSSSLHLTYIYIYIYIYIYLYIEIQKYTVLCSKQFDLVSSSVLTLGFSYMHSVCSFVLLYVCVYIYTYIFKYIYAYTHTQRACHEQDKDALINEFME